MDKENPTKKEFMDSLPNSKIDSLVKIRKTKADLGITIFEDQYPSVREAYTSGKYKNKTALCKEWGISINTLNSILDATGGRAEAQRVARRKWSKDHPDERKEYNQNPGVKDRRKITKYNRIENKKRVAQGLEPIKHERKKPDRNWRETSKK